MASRNEPNGGCGRRGKDANLTNRHRKVTHPRLAVDLASSRTNQNLDTGGLRERLRQGRTPTPSSDSSGVDLWVNYIMVRSRVDVGLYGKNCSTNIFGGSGVGHGRRPCSASRSSLGFRWLRRGVLFIGADRAAAARGYRRRYRLLGSVISGPFALRRVILDRRETQLAIPMNQRNSLLEHGRHRAAVSLEHCERNVRLSPHQIPVGLAS